MSNDIQTLSNAVERGDGAALIVGWIGPNPDRSDTFAGSGRRRSPHTWRAYYRDVSVFSVFMGWGSAEDAAVRLLDLRNGNEHLERFQQSLRAKGERPSTINRRIAAVCSYTTWANRKFGTSRLSVEAYEPREPDHRPPVTASDVEAMLKHAKNAKERLVLRLAFDLGLRCSEIAALHRDDVDFGSRTIMVLSKRRMTKEAKPMPEPTIAALSTWIRERGTEPGSLLGIKQRAIGYLVERCGERAGVGKLSPHRLRHAHITTGLDLGLDAHSAAASARSTVANLQRYDDRRYERAAAFSDAVSRTVKG